MWRARKPMGKLIGTPCLQGENAKAVTKLVHQGAAEGAFFLHVSGAIRGELHHFDLMVRVLVLKQQQASFGEWSPLLLDNERILVQKLRYRYRFCPSRTRRLRWPERSAVLGLSGGCTAGNPLTKEATCRT